MQCCKAEPLKQQHGTTDSAGNRGEFRQAGLCDLIMNAVLKIDFFAHIKKQTTEEFHLKPESTESRSKDKVLLYTLSCEHKTYCEAQNIFAETMLGPCSTLFLVSAKLIVKL